MSRQWRSAAIILRLSLRQTWNRITRNGWTIAGTVLGILYGLGVISGMLFGMLALRLAGAAGFVTPVLLLTACGCALAWVFVHLFVATRPPLTPEQFCLLPLSGAVFVRGALLAHLISIPGVIFTALALLLVIPYTVTVQGTAAALLCVPVAVLVWLLFGRVVADGFAAQLARRKTREITLVLTTMVLLCAGFLLQLLLQPLQRVTSFKQLLEQTETLGEIIQWVPLATPFAAAAHFAAGNYVLAASQLALSLLVCALLWRVWQALLTPRLQAPVHEQGQQRLRDSAALLDRLLPASPLGAQLSRLLRYQMRDPRHLMNLVSVPLLVLMLAVLQRGVLSDSASGSVSASASASAAAPVAGLWVCLLIAWIVGVLGATLGQTDSAYEGETLVWQMLVPVSGKVDRRARILAKLVVYLPVLLVSAAVAGALLGLGIYTLVISVIFCTVFTVLVAAGVLLSAWLPALAPQPEDSLFSANATGGVQSLAGALLGAVGSGLLLALFAVPLFLAAQYPLLLLLVPVVGVLLSCAAVFAAVALAAPVYDRRQAKILAHITKQ